MIIDTLKNAPLYHSVGPRIARALEYLEKTDVARLGPGRYELDGANLFVLVQRYETRPQATAQWEAHRKYIDVQYVAAGTERMGYANLNTLKVTQPYVEKDDCLLLEGPGDFLTVAAGTFVIFAPHDAHMPALAVDAPAPVVKAVVKVKV